MSPTATSLEPHLVTAFPQKPLNVTEAHGAHLVTADGRRLVDLGGASHGVANFGHGHPAIVQAIQDQLKRVTHLVTTVPTPARAEFLERLHRWLPPHLERSFLANSGTEAVEAALKFTHAKTGRTHLVAARNAFHGRTLGALSATFRPAYRKPFESLLRPTDFVPYNDVAALEAAVNDETAAVILEPIQGEGGLAVATDEYLRAAERITHAHGALLIIDEVQTGLGRTGRDLAIQGTGVRPDLLLLGKSLAGGLPIGVAAMTQEVANAMPPGGHGNTFGGSPLVCAAATASLEVLQTERLSERARTEGERFQHALSALASPLVREVRGRGLMIGADLRLRPQPVLERLLQQGYLALPSGVTVVRFLPPLTIERADLEGAVQALGRALKDPSIAQAGAPEAMT